jgi:hypothetical protein
MFPTPRVASPPATTSLVALEQRPTGEGEGEGEGDLRPLLWAELHMHGWPAADGWRLPLTRRKVSELLLAQGLAWPACLEDQHLSGAGKRSMDRCGRGCRGQWHPLRGCGALVHRPCSLPAFPSACWPMPLAAW